MSDAKQVIVKSGGSLVSFSTAWIILFTLLKVFDKIDWSWWLVFAPLWIGWAIIGGGILLAFSIMGIILIGMGIAHVIQHR